MVLGFLKPLLEQQPFFFFLPEITWEALGRVETGLNASRLLGNQLPDAACRPCLALWWLFLHTAWSVG